MPTQHLTTKVLARGTHIHSMHAHVCHPAPATVTHLLRPPPPNSSTASLLPPQFQVLCTAAHTRTTSSRRHAAAKYPIRARAPASAGSFRLPEPQLPSLPDVVKEPRPLIATTCCGRQVAHGHQPRHLQTATDGCNLPEAEGVRGGDGSVQLSSRGAPQLRGPQLRAPQTP